VVEQIYGILAKGKQVLDSVMKEIGYMNDQHLWAYYQKNAKDVFSGNYLRCQLVEKIIAKYAQPNSKILEIGFGDGYLLRRLARKYKCFGADISYDGIEQIKDVLPNVTLSLIDLDGVLPYPDNFFDVFIASEVLEHMTDEQLMKCIDEIKRILKPHGYAIITFPAEENLDENMCFCPNCGVTFHKWGHKQSWNEQKIRNKFNNFNIVKIDKVIIPSNNLNIFGKLEFVLKKLILKLNKKVKGSSFLIILRTNET